MQMILFQRRRNGLSVEPPSLLLTMYTFNFAVFWLDFFCQSKSLLDAVKIFIYFFIYQIFIFSILAINLHSFLVLSNKLNGSL